jgi:short subunit dehydrogenase-like uncharacterized protein
MSEWMLYGANGYTGRLILAEAVRRGHKPIVAGRNAAEVGALARQYKLPARVFDLTHADTTRAGLNGASLVLHCAGPFSATAAPMLEACLANRAHYLDITGEIDVFAHCHAQHERARAAGCVVIPGTGFDVVPSDCLAAMLKRDLPDATELVLAFEGGGGPSPGTAKTGIEGLAKGGRIRRDGKLVRVPIAYKKRTFLRDGKPRSTMTIPWGDVYTAFVSTGIPNIEVYMATPPATIARLERFRALAFLAGFGPVQRLLKSQVETRIKGPSAEKRAGSSSYLWGEARNAAGREVRRELETANGYEVTVHGALGVLEHLLAQAPEGGYFTPSMLMGADYVLRLPGSRLIEAKG